MNFKIKKQPTLNNLPLALAPMQAVTNLPFMQILTSYGAPDYFFTEYFRVHETSKLEPHILESITKNPSTRPIFAQLIGENLEHMARTAKALQNYPVAGIDLNLGCPAPKVYKKHVGGGLLKDFEKIDALLSCLREHCRDCAFTVKTRIGFDSTDRFEELLEIFAKHKLDLLTIHGRTVKQSYRPRVDYQSIAKAAKTLPFPVFANGDISSIKTAKAIFEYTKADGLSIGRSAIRNPWIFKQWQAFKENKPVFNPTFKDVREYIEKLWNYTANKKNQQGTKHLAYIKKFMNFIGQSIDEEGAFLKAVRRAKHEAEFFNICDEWLINEGNEVKLFHAEPYPHIIARPNCEL